MSLTAGVDIGGTKAAAVLIQDGVPLSHRFWLEHSRSGAARLTLSEKALAAVDGVLGEARLTRASLDACGVAIAGLVSADRATVVHAAVLGESRLGLGRQLSAILGTSVSVVNDANATLFGHLHGAAGAEPEIRDVLLLALGTGVGGALAVSGGIVEGANGYAAELGHIVVDYDDERVCLCGSRGCIEQFACGRGLSELVALDPPPPDSIVTRRPDGGIPNEEVVAAAAAGDDWALRLFAFCGTRLGRAIAQLCTALDPELVVIGGTFGHAAGRWLLPAATQELRTRWPFAGIRDVPPITMDGIGPYAGAIGAGLIADRERAVPARTREGCDEHRGEEEARSWRSNPSGSV